MASSYGTFIMNGGIIIGNPSVNEVVVIYDKHHSSFLTIRRPGNCVLRQVVAGAGGGVLVLYRGIVFVVKVEKVNAHGVAFVGYIAGDPVVGVCRAFPCNVGVCPAAAGDFFAG